MEVKPYKIPYPFKKLTKKLVDNIVKDIDEGSTHKYSAEANAITESIFNIWRNQGEVDLEYENENSLCAYLVVSLAKVKQKEIKKCRKSISSRIKSHKGAEWTLEHAYSRDFCGKDAIAEINEEIEKLKKEFYGENSNGNIKGGEKE